jgi:molecular chaperone HtpG
MSEPVIQNNTVIEDIKKQQPEVYDFEAEVPQVMSLIINSVYSSKEMFLRELISNASDAISKLKAKKNEFDEKNYSTIHTGSCKIQVIPDKTNKTLTIKDNGIGMTKADLITFLGTIASSGTKKFKELLNAKNDKSGIDSLIGQFGLGFYSGFLVADKIDVITKNPMDEGYIWSSSCGNNSYEIGKFDVGDLQHGTSIVLHLKEGELEYLESSKIINLIKKHSLYINYPISV